MHINLDGQKISLATLRNIWSAPVDITLGESAKKKVAESCAQVAAVVAKGDSVYGVNTGFGQLAKVRIGADDLTTLQENLIRSHSVGVGQPLADEVVRLTMAMKVIALARGFSGVRPALIDRLCEMLRQDLLPVIPSKGSVGASGDLAPLAHLAGTLLGIGTLRRKGEAVNAAEALSDAGLQPMVLGPKEGLALLNGTQVSTALALAALFRAEHTLAAAVTAGAMSSDAIKGSDTPFDHQIQDVRGHAGQIAVAQQLRELMHGSEIRASHVNCSRVQDPYSVRCQPQVMGACLGVMEHAATVLEVEANAATDNPLVFSETNSILSGGNFHAEPVAFIADYLALAIAEIGSLSERRIALLIDSHLSELPAFLVKDSGLNSGFMMAQVTAAALVSENKTLAHPASVDSIPTSANQEDHVSMATFAARRLHDILDNVEYIVAIELLAASQGVEFHLPKKTSELLARALQQIRELSAGYDQDRSLATDIESVARSIDAGSFCNFAAPILPSMKQ